MSGCIISSKSWVDSRTHIHGLWEVLRPVNHALASEGSNMKGLCIEDYLSSHKTDIDDDFWCNKLMNFELPLFVPANMSLYLQVVDRHIGIRYKNYVYHVYQKEMI